MLSRADYEELIALPYARMHVKRKKGRLVLLFYLQLVQKCIIKQS